MRRLLRSPAFRIAAMALLLALCLLGSRGIWDPDEGRYTNVALNMLDSGDWLNPRRNHEVGHWTKPPLTYWAIAASVSVFGQHAWAARLPAALAYLLSVWLAWRIARRLVSGAQAQAAAIYASFVFTVGASQLVTADYLLAVCSGLAMWAYAEARFGPPRGDPARERRRARSWVALMWAGFALGFLAKGPPALVGLLPILAFNLLQPGGYRVLQWSGLAIFVLMALPWYVAVIADHPGLFKYFVGDEVVNRVATDEFGRNGQWYGWLQVYAPTLVLGTLPWTPALWRWLRGLPAAVRAWRDRTARATDAPALWLALWLWLPLLLFCLARSRMPLYVLPLFLPLAVIAAMQRQREGRALPAWPRLAAWAALLLALKLAAVHWPTHKDASAWAEAIRARAGRPVPEVVFVEDMARYGLHLHLDAQIEKISLDPVPDAPRFNPEFDESLAQELAEHEVSAVWVCKQALWPQLRARIAAAGYRATALGTPYEQRVIFEVELATHRSR
ncbi:ArnT family glycosyltransferase [Lysobacter silvisoli]|uniref:Glycosyltransferase n=1 Tax=Lysobacter silvisoli TaxID=2293254 RepID=A0A371JXT4_9GAMM|nr:glycosyltransferase family 39 protein [Lysobacter silvisoli]RDZ26478.1 glycosyltransferase [Lysobacter silvisoli]